eukprot:jgi/Tetstr1/436275/TSEL_025117.t1
MACALTSPGAATFAAMAVAGVARQTPPPPLAAASQGRRLVAIPRASQGETRRWLATFRSGRPSRRPAALGAAVVCAASTPGMLSINDVEAVPVMENGELTAFPPQAGVYAVYSPEGELQYIGLSRKISASIIGHMQDLPDLVGAVKVCLLSTDDKQVLMASWKAWVQEIISGTGKVPPGNAPGIKDWTQGGTRTVKPEVRLMKAGTAVEDLTCPVEELIDQVVKEHKVVAFIKGTRTEPACGFSFKMLSLLNGAKVEYEVVNVFDEVHNPGLREAIKSFSAWPTIPQLYVDGEFVGGADIIVEMSENGELAEVLGAASS